MSRLVPLFTALMLALTPAMTPGSARATGLDVDAAAVQFVESLSRDLVGAIAGNGMTTLERDARLRSLLHRGLDMTRIGRYVLGNHWEAASGEQLDEYSALFAEYLLGNYSKLLRKYEIKNLTVTAAAPVDNDRDILVTTQAELFFGLPIEWRWRLRDSGAGYRIVDVVAGGVSMASVYRSEFGSVVDRRGLDALLTSLRRRVGPLPDVNAIAPAAGPSVAAGDEELTHGMTN
ncbi:MAG: ABC transporter substrate-binding protein [Kiloniellales bacterium]|nr:ABC transporter substrate-binding protein [Kiloniellales bacterium]